MVLSTEVMAYLEYCRFRKELDEKTLKAYRIDLRQYVEACGDAAANREQMERYVTELHKKFKEAVILPRIIPREDIERFLNGIYA